MDIVSHNNKNLLANFPPILRNNFAILFLEGKIGLYPITSNDIIAVKHYSENNSDYSYYYKLNIPYAGKRFSWELIFDPHDMSFAPDFNFNDDFYLSANFDVILENVPSLSSWNLNNPRSVLFLLKEFITLFKKQQIEKLQSDNIYAQLHSEYLALIKEINPNDVEIFLDNTANFLIGLHLDVSSFPEYVQPNTNEKGKEVLNPNDDTCYLKISFLKLDGSRVNTSLQLSPRLDQYLSNRKPYIPEYSKHLSLSDYVKSVMKALQDQIRKLEQHYKLKKEYMTCLCTVFAENMLEFDSETFSKAEIMWEIDSYSCLVQIEIGELFPEDAPKVTLHSLYCNPTKKTCTEQVDGYLYSPRWSCEEMLNQLTVMLTEKIPLFKNHKH